MLFRQIARRHILAVVALFALGSIAHADSMARVGQFMGLNNHTVTGSVTIEKVGDVYQIRMADDFVFDGAPDPMVALGKDGSYDPDTLIRLLDSNTGAQVYELPASIDPAEYNEVHIWCRKFSVGLGVASIL